jgi:ABC-type transporter Mla subunit MlaD
MRIEREEIRTGALVVLTLAAFVGILLYLSAPGVFVRQKTYWIYFEDVSGMKPGAQVLLAGRKIGQVRRLFSPVPESHRPDPKLEALVEIRVAKSAEIYQQVKVAMAQPKLLGEQVIDFSSGEESSGLAPDGHTFIGERMPGLADAVPAVLDKIDPVLGKATETMEALQKTAENLNKLTDKESDLTATIGEFRQFGRNLNELSGEAGPLRASLKNVQELTGEDGRIARVLDHLDALAGPEGSLAKAIENAERFTARLVNNRDLEVTLRNFRQTSDRLERTVDTVGGQFTAMGANLEQASDLLKHQPWRLIWPTTKKYPDENARAVSQHGATSRDRTPRRVSKPTHR